MRGRLLSAGLGIFTSFAPLLAQFPPPSPLPQSRGPSPFTPSAPLQIPRAPFAPPGSPLPPSRSQPAASAPAPLALPDGTVNSASRVETPLPQPESKFSVDPGAMTMKKINGSWQVWCGPRPFKNLGSDEAGAKDIVRLLHDQHPTEWVSIGSPRPIVEYGLIDGRPSSGGSFPRGVVPVDLRTVCVAPIKGVWCLKDDGNIHFNFGLNKGDADQALAVVRKYGFNRIGIVGSDATAPALSYFFVALEADGAKPTTVNGLVIASQEMALRRTGIPVPGVGYMGEMIKIDSRKVELRRDGADWIVAFGGDVLGRFGQDQNAARDTLRLIQDGQFTEVCRPGPPGLNFFLSNGATPSRMPLFVQGKRFDQNGLRVAAMGPKWAITDRGRHLFEVNSAEEGEAVIRMIKLYQFDQLCQVGTSPSKNLMYLAKGR